MAPNIAMPVAIDARTESVKVRSRNSVSGTRGSGERSSTMTNAITPRMPPPTMRRVSMLHQSKLDPARVTQIRSEETDAASSTMPR